MKVQPSSFRPLPDRRKRIPPHFGQEQARPARRGALASVRPLRKKEPGKWVSRLLGLVFLLGAVAGVGIPRTTPYRHMMSGPYGDGQNPIAMVTEWVDTYESPRTVEDFALNPQQAFWGNGAEIALQLKNNPEAAADRSDLENMRAVDKRRAEFNQRLHQAQVSGKTEDLTHALHLLNLSLPYRFSLYGDPVRLSTHDRLIDWFANHPDIRYVFIDASDGKAYPMDDSTRYLVAASVMDLMHNRWQLLETQLIEKNPPLYFIQLDGPASHKPRSLLELAHPPSNSVAGFYLGGTDDILLDVNASIWPLVAEQKPLTLPIHEVAHGLDGDRLPLLPFSRIDGQLADMPPGDRQVLQAEFDRLKQALMAKIAHHNQESFQALSRDVLQPLMADDAWTLPLPSGGLERIQRIVELLERQSRLEADLSPYKLEPEEIVLIRELSQNGLSSAELDQVRDLYMQNRLHNPEVRDIDGVGVYAFQLDAGLDVRLGLSDPKVEFNNVLLELFYTNPRVLYDASPRAYNIYGRYFALDPLHNYRDLTQADVSLWEDFDSWLETFDPENLTDYQPFRYGP